MKEQSKLSFDSERDGNENESRDLCSWSMKLDVDELVMNEPYKGIVTWWCGEMRSVWAQGARTRAGVGGVEVEEEGREEEKIARSGALVMIGVGDSILNPLELYASSWRPSCRGT